MMVRGEVSSVVLPARETAAAQTPLVEVACELAALDPPRGSEPQQQLEDAACTTWMPCPTAPPQSLVT